MENINNTFISSNSRTENKNSSTDVGWFKTQGYSYISNFSENTTGRKEIKYKVIKDKSVFDE